MIANSGLEASQKFFDLTNYIPDKCRCIKKPNLATRMALAVPKSMINLVAFPMLALAGATVMPLVGCAHYCNKNAQAGDHAFVCAFLSLVGITLVAFHCSLGQSQIRAHRVLFTNLKITAILTSFFGHQLIAIKD